MSAFGFQRFLHRIDGRSINSVGRENRHLARLDIARQQVGLAQRWRLLQRGLAHFDRAFGWRRQAEVFRHAFGQGQVDIGEDFVHFTGTDELTLDLAQLEAVGSDDVLFLVLAHAVEEQAGLGEVIAERFAALTDLRCVDALRVALETTVLCRWRGFFWPAAVDRVRLVRGTTLIDGGAVLRVTLAVVERRHRTVDRQLMEVRPAESADLRVGVGEQSTLQQRVIGKVDAWHDVARAESDLLGFREEVVRVAVQGHFAQRRNRNDFLGDDLGRVEDVEVEVVFVLFFDDLHAQLPFRVVAHLDRFPQVATMVVGVFTGELLRLVPHQRAGAGGRAPVEFDEA